MACKKRIRPGKIEACGDRPALLVHFVTEVTQVGDDGQLQGILDKVPGTREVPIDECAIRGAGVQDIPALALEIVESCRYIPPSKAHQVEKALLKLQAAAQHYWDSVDAGSCPAPCSHTGRSAIDSGSGGARRPPPHPVSSGSRRHKSRPPPPREPPPQDARRRHSSADPVTRQGDRSPTLSPRPAARSPSMSPSPDPPLPRRGRSRKPPRDSCEANKDVPPALHLARLMPEASLDALEDYVEELYEESLELKANGAVRVLRLCTQVSPMEEVVEHISLLKILCRELRENGKRSHDLAVAISGTFLCLAHFSEFHETLVAHHAHEGLMKVLEFEKKRFAALGKELELARAQSQAPRPVVDRGGSQDRAERSDWRKAERRYCALLCRQEQLLGLCVLSLLYLAEVPDVEKELLTQGACTLLVPLLSRKGDELLRCVLLLIQRLSMFEVAKDLILNDTNVVSHLVNLLGHSDSEVKSLSLRVCYNLSFDPLGCSMLTAQSALLRRLPTLVGEEAGARLLYQLSLEPDTRRQAIKSCPEMAACLCVLLARGALDGGGGDEVGTPAAGPDRKPATAVCINFAADVECAAHLLEAPAFAAMALGAIRGEDAVLLKVVRHMARHASLRPRFLEVMRQAEARHNDWLHELVQLMGYIQDRPDLLVESLGILAGLDCPSPDVAWASLCEEGLLEVLQAQLVSDSCDDDVLLETVMAVGVLAMDPPTEPMLARSKIPAALQEALGDTRHDTELTIQMLFSLRCCLLAKETGEVLLQDTSAPQVVMDVLRDLRPYDLCDGLEKDSSNATGAAAADPSTALAVRAAAVAACEDFLGLVLDLDTDGTWASRVKTFFFELHNEEWCHGLVHGFPPPPQGSHSPAQGPWDGGCAWPQLPASLFR